jgi:hypothetical protein
MVGLPLRLENKTICPEKISFLTLVPYHVPGKQWKHEYQPKDIKYSSSDIKWPIFDFQTPLRDADEMGLIKLLQAAKFDSSNCSWDIKAAHEHYCKKTGEPAKNKEERYLFKNLIIRNFSLFGGNHVKTGIIFRNVKFVGCELNFVCACGVKFVGCYFKNCRMATREMRDFHANSCFFKNLMGTEETKAKYLSYTVNCSYLVKPDS